MMRAGPVPTAYTAISVATSPYTSGPRTRPAIAWYTKPPTPATRPPRNRTMFCWSSRLRMSWASCGRRPTRTPVFTSARFYRAASGDNSHPMPESTKPIVTALIVNRNSKDDLLQALKTFFASADVPVDAVVVDNDSSDGSAAAVTDEFPQVTVLVQSKDLGYGRAANIGLERCQGRFILLLSPDVRLEPQCVGRLADFLLTRPDAGAVGPKLLLRNGKIDPDSRRAFPIPSTLFYQTVGLNKIFPNSPRFGRA